MTHDDPNIFSSPNVTDILEDFERGMNVPGEPWEGSMTSVRLKVAKWLAPELEQKSDYWEVACEKEVECLKSAQRALRSIIALKTPGCAHVGRKMADVAEQALKSGGE